MSDVITLSSDDSDVEVVGSTRAESPPLSPVRLDVSAASVKVPSHCIDLTNSRWALPGLKMRKRKYSTALEVVDLTECNVAEGPEQETKTLLPGDFPVTKESTNKNKTSNKRDFNLKESSLRDSIVLVPQQDCGYLKPKLRHLESHTRDQKQNYNVHPCRRIPAVTLRQLPFHKKHLLEMETARCSAYLTTHCSQMSQGFKVDINSHAPECMSDLRTTTASNRPPLDGSSKVAESVLGQELQKNRDQFAGTLLDDLSRHPSTQSPTAKRNPSELSDLDSLSSRSLAPHDPPPTSEHASEWQLKEVMAERTSDSPERSGCDIQHELLSVSETEDVDENSQTGTYCEDLETQGLLSFLWQEESDTEQVNEESRFDVEYRAASQEDQHFVCPDTLKEIMSGSSGAWIDVADKHLGTPEVLCHQSLSLVYSTIEEDYPEGTLQLLSDLLQPGYYPPRDITTHLLQSILLNPQCPRHLCAQAFSLLMRTQRHHTADKTTVPWDWELLSSVMANQDCTRGCRCEVVRMFLEYVVQVLEDDFKAKSSTSALHRSIAKITLSCDKQFPRVREVIKWLFSAIMKSTQPAESRETARERREQIRMVSLFQRMLSLALEVDLSPTLSSVKLSLELFHMLISDMSLRAHRMLLLESLQNHMLKCKLLEHLMDYACPMKVSLPMSLSLLLHFLKYCTLAPDLTDGTERWQKWEELVNVLWMLLLSYNKSMEGCLCNLDTKQSGRIGTLVYKPDDKVSKPAIREAVEVFLSRSQADLGQALPLHVEESLTYLQDYLLDVCHC